MTSRLGQDPPAPGPVFILSTMRTGSTLLRYCLDTHPDVFCPPELHLGLAAAGLFRMVAGLEGQGVRVAPGSDVDAATADANPAIVERVRGLLEEVVAPYAEQQGKRIWCEKSPSNLQHLQLLDRLFPEARHLCLYRDCLDVAQSLLEISRLGFVHELQRYVQASPDNVLAAVVGFWADQASLLLAFEREHPDRTHRVRYEDLVTAPGAVLRGICGFLGLPWHEGLVESIFTRSHGRGLGDSKIGFARRIHDQSVGAGQFLRQAELPAELRRRMDALMAEVGYTGDRPAPASAPVAGGGPGAEPAAGHGRDVRRLFDDLLPRVAREHAELAAAVDGAYRFVVGGDGGGEWVLDLTRGGCRVLPGGAAAEYSVVVSAPDLVAIVDGSLSPVSAWSAGRVRVLGSPPEDRLQQLVRLLSLLPVDS